MAQAWNSLISFPRSLWQHATSMHQKLGTQLNVYSSMLTSQRFNSSSFNFTKNRQEPLGPRSILSNSQLYLSLLMPRYSRVAVDICKYLLLLHVIQKPQAILPGRWMGCGWSASRDFERVVKSWITMNRSPIIYISSSIDPAWHHEILWYPKKYDIFGEQVTLAYRTLDFHNPCIN